MVLTEKLQNFLLGATLVATALTAAYQVAWTNTWLDRTTAKHVWCGASEEPRDKPAEIDFSEMNEETIKFRKLDNAFENMRPGDSLIFGPISVIVTDSRPQRRHYGPNDKGDYVGRGVLTLGCPGYIEVDVTYDGEPVGKGRAKMAYASKMSPFPEFPNFRLSDVLRETGLNKSERQALIDRAFRAIRAERQERFDEALEELLAQGPPASYNSRAARQCRARFSQVEGPRKMRTSEGMTYEAPSGIFEYKVRRGDNKIAIAKRIDACSEGGAFWPLSIYTRGNPGIVCKEEGVFSCPYEDSRLSIGQKVRVLAGGWMTLPAEEDYY